MQKLRSELSAWLAELNWDDDKIQPDKEWEFLTFALNWVDSEICVEKNHQHVWYADESDDSDNEICENCGVSQHFLSEHHNFLNHHA